MNEDLEREFETRLVESSTLAFRVAYSVLRHREDAEDVAQESGEVALVPGATTFEGATAMNDQRPDETVYLTGEPDATTDRATVRLPSTSLRPGKPDPTYVINDGSI